MDKHVLHNVIHQDAGNNSNDCPVCNGTTPMTDKSGMMQKANDVLKKKQKNGFSFTDDEKELLEFATLSSKDRDNMDNSSFAYVDSKGGTHLPINDAAHVRNALARFNQTNFDDPSDKPKAMAKIKAAAKKFGVDVSDENKNTEVRTFVNLLSFAEKGNLPTRFKILPTGTFKTRYGETKITYDDVKEMKQHFDEGLRNSSNKIGLPVDLEHGDTAMKDAAGAWMKKLDAQPDGLYADDVSYTSIGNKSLNEGIYKLFSPSFYLKDYVDPETGEKHDNVLTGGAFCNKPVLGHSLPPLVYSENGQNTLLTQDENSNILFVEIEKTSMELHEIAKKAKNERTSEEQKFLSEHHDELTFAEAKAEGLVPEAPKKGELKLSEGQVAVDAKEWSETKEAAKKGEEAHHKFAELEMEKEIKGLIENDEGIAVKKDQIPTMVKLAMSMSEDNRKAYFETLKVLPKQKIFKEEGSDTNAVNLSENPRTRLDALTRVKMSESKKDGKELNYSDAQRLVMSENAELKTAVQSSYTGGN